TSLQDTNLQDTSLQHSNRSRPPTRQMISSQHFLLLLTALAMPLLTTFASTSTHSTEEPNKPLNTSHSSKDSNQIETEDRSRSSEISSNGVVTLRQNTKYMTWQTRRKMSTQHSQHNNTTYSPSYLRIHLLRSQSTKTTPLPAKTRRQQHKAWSMSWRENNIKTEEKGGEEEVEDGNSKTEVREC
ncbi:hypothetical protein J6590_041939, partial [Homalodisca vitripennis]